GIQLARDVASGTDIPTAGRDAKLRRTRSHLLVYPAVPRVGELPRAVPLRVPILVESGPADHERLLGEDDEILKSPSPFGTVGTGQLDLRLPDEMTRQHRLGSE